MIVKIWPVKGAQGVKKAKLYIEDDNKVIKVELDDEGTVASRTVIDTQHALHQDADSFFVENEEDLSRVMEYMANEDKTKNKFISGFRCAPESALTDFETIRTDVVCGTGTHKRPQNVERETMAFHMVQSFPEELDISDEEVHQCGLELLEKIGKHQGIVCSHVHPVVDDEGEVHGKCKHNHILFNAFVMPDMIDPEHPERIKYNDCRETYAQLQVWNDEIAIDHGLPIIRDPDLERTYSWFENNESKKGRSWKERVRLDIEAARRASGNWDEFVAVMQQSGYQIRDGAHVTYTAPDGEHKVRGNTLGQIYTKEHLELYWTVRDRTEQAVRRAVKANEAPPLWRLAQQHGALTVDIPLGIERQDEPPIYALPLEKAERSREVLSTYFDEKDLYAIRDAQGRAIASATGHEVIDYLDALRRGEAQIWDQAQQQRNEQEHLVEEEEQRRRLAEEEEEKKKQYSSNFRNSRTGRRYYIDLRDENGRHRSSLELIFLLALVVLKTEDGLWDRLPSDGKENEAVFGPTNWKIQNMIDSIHYADQEGLQTPAQVDERVNEVGAAYSRARSALQKTKRAQEKMEALAKALDVFDETKEIAERIQALPEGPEKEKLKEQYAEAIERYKKAKAVMYGYKVTTQREIDDFRERYADIMANLPSMQEDFDRTKEQYRQMKKLQYNMALAQNAQYCYGPAYDAEAAYQWVEQGQFAEQQKREQEK